MRAAVAAALAATGALGVALALRPGDRALAVDVYLLFAGAVALIAVLALTLAPYAREEPSALDRRPPLPPPDRRPRDLVRLEREIELATQTAFDAHYRLRPTLRPIAETRLRARGVDLDSAPGTEALLGPEAWELVRPDRPRPRRHDAPGPTLAAIDAAVAALEEL